MPATETGHHPPPPAAIFGRGFYSVPEAARLIGVNARTLRRWAVGYGFKRPKGPRSYPPVTRRELAPLDGLVELTFLDLVELLFIATFLQAGVSLHAIRRAAKSAAQLLGVKDHPFCLRRFRTDGRRIFKDMQLDDDQLRLQLGGRPHVFDEVVEPFLRKLEYDAGTDLVKRWWPLGRDRLVVVDPALNFGAPVLKSSGIPTRAIKQLAGNPGDRDRKVAEAADWYEISPQAVEDALAFEDRLKVA